MKLLLPLILLAGVALCQTPVQTPPTVTPDDAPLPPKRTNGYSELEAANPNEPGVLSLGKYEGGSARLKASRLTTYVNQKEIVLVQNKQRFAIPVKNVTAVLYGNAAQGEVAQTIGDNALAGGKKENPKNPTLVGIVWTAGAGKNGVVLQVDKGDFNQCMNALQTVTGLKAVNADAR